MLCSVLRTAVMVYALGSHTSLAEVYNVTNVIPNVLYDLLLGGVLGGVLVPVLIQAGRDRDGGLEFIRSLLTVTAVTLGGLSLVAIGLQPDAVVVAETTEAGQAASSAESSSVNSALMSCVMRSSDGCCLRQLMYFSKYSASDIPSASSVPRASQSRSAGIRRTCCAGSPAQTISTT